MQIGFIFAQKFMTLRIPQYQIGLSKNIDNIIKG